LKRTEKVEVVSIAASVVMAGGMLTVALITNSISILAEAIDTIVDIVASISVLIGLKLSSRRSSMFPNGLYKLENLISTAIGALILFSAYELARESIERIVSDSAPLDSPWLVIVTMAAVVACTFLLAHYKGTVGREENSPSLKADAKHSLSDAIASIAIIFGVGMQMAGVPHMDSIVALAVTVFLFWTGVQVTIGGLRVLLDASIESELLDKTRSIVMADPRVRSVLRVEGRNSGSYRFLDISIVPWDSDLRVAEEMAEDLKREIRGEIENVDQVSIEFEAGTPGSITAAYPLEGDGNLVPSRLDNSASFELLGIDTDKGEAVSGEMLYLHQDAAGNAVRLAVLLSRLELDVLLTREMDLDGSAYQVLNANGVQVISRPDVLNREDAARALLDYAARPQGE